MTQAVYKLLKDSPRGKAKAGNIVYTYTGYDYGLARDDTEITGKEHISVVLCPDTLPFFTIPVRDLEEISMTDETPNETVQSLTAMLRAQQSGALDSASDAALAAKIRLTTAIFDLCAKEGESGNLDTPRHSRHRGSPSRRSRSLPRKERP